jgi:hypothetical protein
MSTITVNTTINNAGNVVNSVGLASNDSAQAAQSFTTVGAGTISSCNIKCAYDGSSTSTAFYLQIFSDSSGSPGSMITNGESNSHPLSDFTPIVTASCFATSPSAVTFTWPTPPTVAAFTTYWLVLTTKGVYDATNNPRWCGDTSNANGQNCKDSTTTPTTWGAANGGSVYAVITVTDATGGHYRILLGVGS